MTITNLNHRILGNFNTVFNLIKDQPQEKIQNYLQFKRKT